MTTVTACGCLTVLAIITAVAGQAMAEARLKTYHTKYYIIHTDIARDDVREAEIWMTAMADEYRRRTKGFSRTIKKRLPFYLFSKKEDYIAAGGLEGSAGIFRGGSLMVIAGKKTSNRTWRIIQHEGFHQFAFATIGPRLPIWANEGMAVYFEESIFTGDGFVTGLIPPARLARLKKEIEDGRLKSFSKMMTITNREWNQELSICNYDQAWSMIYFLVHAEDGKYRKAATAFLNNISKGMPYLSAWTKNFGKDIKAFEKRWQEYWLALPKNPTEDLYNQALAETLTSFFARAYSQGQKFKDADEFFEAAQSGKLQSHKNDWLPPSLLTDALANTEKMGEWSIEVTTGRPPNLVCTQKDGKKFVGAFVLNANRVKKVSVEITGEDKPKGD